MQMEGDEESRIIDISCDDKTSTTKAERQLQQKHKNFKWKLSAKEQTERINERHYDYYSVQLPSLDWTSFNATMTSKLPVTFRFCSRRSPFLCYLLRRVLAKKVQELTLPITLPSGEVVNEVMHSVLWSPDTYQLNFDSATLKDHIPLSALHTFLTREVSLGHVVRQELVSMIPAIALQVEPQHCVLDICAAPGSKTEQLMSYLTPSHGNPFEGMLVVNDADTKRITTLTERYGSCMPPNVIVTCAKAHHLQQAIGSRMFDRIVCDVPCTGDGTFRKCPHLWRLFRPRFAFELHSTQLDIAISCLLMLKRGGRMVYSTCSLNPIEDEAVVAALILYARSIGMDIKLCDPRTAANGKLILPGLLWHDGVTSWRCDEAIAFAGETPEEKKESRKRFSDFAPTMQCPPSAIVETLNLSRCMRIFPQDQNTGGFFVAILDYVGDYTQQSEGVSLNSVGRNASTSNKTFQQLGYNPKQKDDSNKKRKRNRESLHVTYANLEDNDECCDAVLDVLAGALPDDMNISIASIMTEQGILQPSRCDVMSDAVVKSLQEWGNHSELVVQAGAKAFEVGTKKRISLTPVAGGLKLIAPWIYVSIDDYFAAIKIVRDKLRTDPTAAIELSTVSINTESDVVCIAIDEASIASGRAAEDDVPAKRRMSKAERKKAKKGMPNVSATSSESHGIQRTTSAIPSMSAFEALLVLQRCEDSSYKIISSIDEVNSLYDCCKALFVELK